MASTPSEFRIASLSDIHLGHRRTRTEHIVANLRAALPDNAETGQLDLIVLAGDVFDTLLNLPNEDVLVIDVWIAHLLRLAKKHDIVVRVLEGTPRHDWKQSERFTTINELVGIGANLQYVKTLSIEYIERYGITVLYVPDEWNTTTDKTLSQVRTLLRAKGLTQVDYAIMHGQFGHQLPAFISTNTHDAEAYLSLVRELIFIGHDHTHTVFDRIIAQGSFDRLAHGEEEAKGHVRTIVRSDGSREITFVENKGAKRYVTITCESDDVDTCLQHIASSVQDLPADSYVRLRAAATHPLLTNMTEVIRQHPSFNWSKDAKATEQTIFTTEEAHTTKYIPITLTKDNLGDLLMERAAATGASIAVLDAAVELLQEVL